MALSPVESLLLIWVILAGADEESHAFAGFLSQSVGVRVIEKLFDAELGDVFDIVVEGGAEITRQGLDDLDSVDLGLQGVSIHRHLLRALHTLHLQNHSLIGVVIILLTLELVGILDFEIDVFLGVLQKGWDEEGQELLEIVFQADADL